MLPLAPVSVSASEAALRGVVIGDERVEVMEMEEGGEEEGGGSISEFAARSSVSVVPLASASSVAIGTAVTGDDGAIIVIGAAFNADGVLQSLLLRWR